MDRDLEAVIARMGHLVRLAMIAFGMFAADAATTLAANPSCAQPALKSDGLMVGDPEAEGFDRDRLCALLKAVTNDPNNLHSLLVLRHGRLVTELYKPGTDRTIYSLWGTRRTFNADTLHDMRSTSKSIVGLLYGILLARGEVASLETSVASLYPEEQISDADQKRAIGIRDLLTMSTGLQWEEASPVHRLSGLSDELGLLWRKEPFPYVFSFPVTDEPRAVFTYSGGATALLADIMTRQTGKDLRRLAGDLLFEPLGITDWQWTATLRGEPFAAAGLRLTPRDLLKIGAMLSDHGRWQGRQIVPADWIVGATRPQISAGPRDGYGYQFWTRNVTWRGKSLEAAATVGNGGQSMVMIPGLDLVVVTTAGNYGEIEGLELVRGIVEEVVETVR
ncbi:serine hydrolase [Rhizobium sp. CRIBSB]|nr:serine hydrolase [Rhizobium sp. CRIBSB]